jgi:hypothetical protein
VIVERLPQRVRRPAAFGLLAALIALLIAIGTMPFWLARIEQARLARLEAQIAAAEARALWIAELTRRTDLTSPAGFFGATVFTGATPALAAAELQGLAVAILRYEGAEVRSVEPLPPVEGAPLVKIGVRLRADLDLANLQHLLHALETSTPLVMVASLQVRALGQDEDARLDTTLELVAWAITDESAQNSS